MIKTGGNRSVIRDSLSWARLVLPNYTQGGAFWYDASDTTSLTLSGSETVSIHDKSGNSLSAIQLTSAQRPISGTRTINGLNALDFDGTAHNMAIPAGAYDIANGDNTLFVVFQADLAGGATQRLINGQDAGTGRYYAGINATGFTALNNASNTGPATETWTKVDTPSLGIFRRSGTAQYTNINGGAGASNSSATSFTMTQLLIGAQTVSSNFYNGLIGEIYCARRALTLDEINNRAANYFAPKWGVAWTAAT